MFQFTTTTVINSQYAVDYNGNPLKDAQGNNVPKFSTRDALTKLFVAKVGTINKDNIVSLHKRDYSAAVNSVVAFTVPALTANLVYRLTVKIRLSGAADSDYVNYTTDFRKPVVVEIKATGTAATDAAAFAKAFSREPAAALLLPSYSLAGLPSPVWTAPVQSGHTGRLCRCHPLTQ